MQLSVIPAKRVPKLCVPIWHPGATATRKFSGPLLRRTSARLWHLLVPCKPVDLVYVLPGERAALEREFRMWVGGFLCVSRVMSHAPQTPGAHKLNALAGGSVEKKKRK